MTAQSHVDSPPIEAHGLIGDQGTAALVAENGAVTFLCWPHFDSGSIFASLLDSERGGEFRIEPVLEGARSRQMYLPDTNVLVTRFAAPDGIAEMTDFMPFPAEGCGPKLVRRVRVVAGEVCFRLRCAPRFDYARLTTRAQVSDKDTVILTGDGGGVALRLCGGVPLRVETDEGGDAAVAEFTLRANEETDFVLLDAEEGPAALEDVTGWLQSCVAFWQKWSHDSTYRGRWRETVQRSALTLKLMTSRVHGSIAAAVTFGLPETPGGSRNWDYRATWIRDASFTVYAFMRLGYIDEAMDFMRWTEARAKSCDSEGIIRIMYALDGSANLEERELPHLRGYGGAVPVRIGNAAFDQVQLDIYGELLDAVYLANKYGASISYEGWQRLVQTIGYVSEHWGDPDQGIWEVRGPPQHWLHSRVMCWVALDRASRLALKRSLPAPFAKWRETRDAIHASIWSDFWRDDLGRFVAVKGEDILDGSMLMLPLVRFVSATDPRWLATLDAIGEDLVQHPLVFRHDKAGQALRREGAFTTCSFWYSECLARAGRIDQARLVFEKMLTYANPLGLFSEEIGLSGEQLGNTPQALTHLALISAAFYIDRELSRVGHGLWSP